MGLKIQVEAIRPPSGAQAGAVHTTHLTKIAPISPRPPGRERWFESCRRAELHVKLSVQQTVVLEPRQDRMTLELVSPS